MISRPQRAKLKALLMNSYWGFGLAISAKLSLSLAHLVLGLFRIKANLGYPSHYRFEPKFDLFDAHIKG